MKLVKESLSQIVECDEQQLVESYTPSLEAIETRVADMNPHLDCEVQAQIALKLRDMVRCAIQCAAEEFGVANIDAARWLNWVVEDLKINGCPDDCVAQIFDVPEDVAESDIPAEKSDSPVNSVESEELLSKESNTDDFQQFLKDAEVILVDDARSFDINEWEAQNSDHQANQARGISKSEDSAPTNFVDYWRVIYRCPSGIYSTAVAEGSKQVVEDLFKTVNLGNLVSCEKISEEEFKTLVANGILNLTADSVESAPSDESDKLTEAIAQEDRLEDLIKGATIKSIWVYDDIEDAHFMSSIKESISVDEDEDPSEEEYLLSLPDARLVELPKEQIQEITNLELLDRIAKSANHLLSEEQLDTLRKAYAKKLIIDRPGVLELLNKIQSCSRLFIAGRPKNQAFLDKHNLDTEQCLDIIRQLEVEDFVATTTKGFNLKHFGNQLVIFEPANVCVGELNLGDLTVYIKIDLDESSKDAVVAVSFHETDHPNHKPYAKEESLEESVQVAVDTDEQKVDVEAAEDSGVDISIKPQDSVESFVEDELAALAEDPKYAKAYDYLLHLVDSEEVVEDDNQEPLEEDLNKATPYMLRNDGDLQDVSPLHPYIKYGHETVERALKALADTRLRSLEWFYQNTQSQDTKQLIGSVVAYLIDTGKIGPSRGEFCGDLVDVYHPKDEDIAGFVEELAANTNQEFCRIRTSNLLFRGNSDDIYFRISSIRFNWFDLIWSLVYKYRNNIGTVTVCKDSNTFGGKYDPYKVGGVALDHLSTTEFLTLSGNPVVEDLQSETEAITEANKALKAGQLISEAYDSQLHPTHVSSFYKTQVDEVLQEDLEHLLTKTTEQEEEVVEAPAEKSTLEVEPPKGPEDNFVAEQLGILIKDEYDAIEGYNRFLQDLEANDLGDDSDKKVICDILAEENVHIGQLQELLKKVAPTAENIEVGAEEAKAQIEAAEEDDVNED